MKKINVDTFLEYKFISNLSFNYSGSNLAFTVSESNLDNNGYSHYIWIKDKKNNFKKLTNLRNEKNFFWLDDENVVFISDRDQKINKLKDEGETWTSLYSININGGEASKFLDLPLSIVSMKKIDKDTYILTAIHDNNSFNINSLTGEERIKAISKYKDEKEYEVIDEIPFWGNGLGFTNKKRKKLYIYNHKENKLLEITDNYTDVESFRYKDGKILFVSLRFTDKQQQTNELTEYDIKTNKTKVIIPDKKYNISYADYFDGKIVAALSDMKKHGINENQDLYIIEGKKIKKLIRLDASIGSSVGSDCRLGGGYSIKVHNDKIYFISTKDDYSCLNYVDKDGNKKVLTSTNGSVDFFDIHDNELFFVGMKDYLLQEVYSLKNNKEKKVSSFNKDIFENYYISLPEKIEFESNGHKTEGYVIKPIDYKKNKKYPAILDIHGGPKTVYGNVFYHEMQVWANKGYFVFFCNPHGSDGKGDEFADIRGKYGTIDYEDLMNFTDLVLKKYNIDKNNVGVTGGSYGGYMTNWIIGHTDRFKCAASQRSISNWISKFGTTDIGYYFNADQNLSTPWENHDKLWWHSPLKYANNVKTPTLFIHSEEDYRCWLPEGIQMFTALKYFGVDARLCMFRKENHELSRSGRPKGRIKRLNEITDWFEKYLK